MWLERRLLSFDETPIFYRTRTLPRQPKAVLLLIHGAGEHGGRYQSFADYLAEFDIATVLPDWRGYGKSGGKKAVVRQIEDYFKDTVAIHQAISHQFPGVDFFLMGHSFGALLAASIQANFSLGAKGLVLTSPLCQVSLDIPWWKKIAGNILSVLTPSLTLDTGIRPTMLTRVPAILEDYAKDKLILQKMSLRLYQEMNRLIAMRHDTAKKVTCPVLVIQAGEDRVVSKDAAITFYHELASNEKQMHVIDGSYHEVLNDSDREKVRPLIGRWILDRINKI